MVDQKLSALTELAAEPADNDEAYIRDVSEAAVSESKRITIANLVKAKAVAAVEAAGLDLEASKPVKLPTLSASTYSGFTVGGTAAETLAYGDLVYEEPALGRWALADADAVGTSGAVILGFCVTGASVGQATEILLWGSILLEAFPTVTPGAALYVGTTAGDFQTTPPSGSGDVVRIIGYGKSSDDEIFFCPDKTYVEVVSRYPIASTLSDHQFSGNVTVDIQAGENLVFGDAVYMKSDGKAWKSDADADTTMPIFGIAIATINAEASGEILNQGWIRDEDFSLTAGGIVYASVTPGEISGTAPVDSGDQVQVVGIAKTTKLFYLNPGFELVEIS